MNSLVLSFGAVFVQVYGHGYMFTPINRASRWRLAPNDWTIPHCYEDNQFFCGGKDTMYDRNGGKCGPCGNNWADPIPRSNENGGTYGKGVVVETYSSGDVVETAIRITANHLGQISYQLCKLADPDVPETEECFQDLQLSDGTYYQSIGKEDFNVTSHVKLPDNFICDRCVFRWHYKAGNQWGNCGNGTSGPGCGPHEHFISCADIRILPNFPLFRFRG